MQAAPVVKRRRRGVKKVLRPEDGFQAGGTVFRVRVAEDKRALITSHAVGRLENAACARVFREARKTAPGAGALPGQ